jgi:hypothetical protein
MALFSDEELAELRLGLAGAGVNDSAERHTLMGEVETEIARRPLPVPA